MSESAFFEQFIEDYFAEAGEHLAVLRRTLLSLEERQTAGPPSPAVLQELARSLHTLKGLSGMVGLSAAERVAHVLEDGVRTASAAQKPIDPTLLQAFFEGTGMIERCVATRRATGSAVPPEGFSAELTRLEAMLGRTTTPAPQTTDAASPRAGESPPTGSETEVFHFEFSSSRELAARGMGVEAIRRRLEAFGTVLEARPRVVAEGGVVFDFWVAAPPGNSPDETWRADGMRWTITALPEAHGAAVAAAEARPPAEPAATTAVAMSGSNVVRVDLARLDEVMRIVGELVVSRARLDELLPQASLGITGAWQALDEVNAQMERQLRTLRDGVTRIRLVPMGEVFERLRFAARDVAREAGKQVVVDTTGQGTEVDKAVVDRILEPLMHLVRNAVSHGLESPEERRAGGKSAEGRLWLRASAAGDRIHIEVEDDGAGIDAEHVAARARALGIVAEGHSADESLLDLISAPGVSTRDAADMASGRGVGMDVVRSTVRALGGELSVRTERGRGTCFAIELPLTLMIVDALLVEVGGQRMAVPQPVLREIIQLEGDAVTRFESNDVIAYRGAALPLLSLRRLFGMPDDWRGKPYLLVIGDAQPTGLVVDRLLGIREIVVHAVTDPLVAMPGIGGATELGDGRVSLILDTAALVRLARERQEAQAAARAWMRRPVSATRPLS